MNLLLLASAVLLANDAGQPAEPGPPAQVPAVAVRGEGLDCRSGLTELVKAMLAQPGVAPMPVRADQPFIAYQHEPTMSLYSLTMPSHPAHPTMVKRQVKAGPEGVAMVTSACGYGDKAAFDQLMTEFDDLNGKIRETVGRQTR